MSKDLYNPKYLYNYEMKGVIIDTKKIEVLEGILKQYSMQYKICFECKVEDSICTMSFDEIKTDIFLEQKAIKSIVVEAESETIGFELDTDGLWVPWLKIKANEKNKFDLFKRDIQEWIKLCKNKNPLVCLVAKNTKSYILIGFISVVLSVLTWLPVIIGDLKNGLMVPFDSCFIIIFFSAMVFFGLTLWLSRFFIKNIEIDIGINKTRIRRKIGGWILTVLIIPFIISLFCSII